MKQTGKCPKCGSEDIIADAKAIDRSHAGVQEEMAVATFRRPEALLFKEQQISNVSASERATCGYVEFYADTPAAIKRPKD